MPSSARTGGALSRQRGLSLVESLVAAAITTTAAAAVATGLATWRIQLGVQHAAAEFETDVQYARSLALTRNETVRLSLEEAADGTCWIVHTGPRGACRCAPGGLPECNDGAEALRLTHWAARQPLRIEANARSIAFDALHGTATPAGTVRFTAAGARPIHQVVSIMGRVRSCVPGGGLSGFRAC
jgi:type IV fimbrial biogenesis protein FimT